MYVLYVIINHCQQLILHFICETIGLHCMKATLRLPVYNFCVCIVNKQALNSTCTCTVIKRLQYFVITCANRMQNFQYLKIIFSSF